MYEALQQLRFEEFMDTLDEKSQENVYSLIVSMKDALQHGRLLDDIHSEVFEELITKYETFVTEFSAASKTFAYWSMYIKMAGNVFESLKISFL